MTKAQQKANEIIQDAAIEKLSEAAALLGRIRTKKKAAAARRNGKLGGRPKKARP
jgi:hypothetical protein